MTRQIVHLNDNRWQFGQAPRRDFTGVELYDLPAVTEWLPATVPGNVRTDLLALGRIPDPFFGEGYRESLWVETVDWWYRRLIEVEPLPPGRRAFLIFEGIDYLSAIFVNGREMARHEGMFSRQAIEISEALRVGNGRVEVAVRLWGSTALPPRRLNPWQRAWQRLAGRLHGSWVGVYPDRSATLKCQMSFGWDFAPPIRTMGIWDEVRLVLTGPIFIAAAKASAAPLLSSSPPEAGQEVSATFLIELELDSRDAGPVEASVQISPANFSGPAAGPFLYSLRLPAGSSRLKLRCHVAQAALWQPWDRGTPHLYNVAVTLKGAAGEILDTVTLRTGVRAATLAQWQFKLNGRPEFIRGLNWVPADSFPGRVGPDRYAQLLTLARNSGANLLRVWGGGLREKQAFYDLCDELGLLVWQEFPFACMFLGAYPSDPAYLARVKAECGAIVRQLGSHPCLAAWCGGNEFSRLRNGPLLRTLADVVRREAPALPFIPVSPGLAGDVHHWDVWHGRAPFQAYQAETARFLSEFGLQALPHLETLRAALPDPTNPQSWPTHHADPVKLNRYRTLFEYPLTPKSKIENLKSKIVISQRAQAIALQTAIEHMRRRKGEAGGCCLWQFNEPWPAIGWAIVDYFGRPKLAYDGLLNWYNPVLVCLKFPAGRRWQAGDCFVAEIWAINDSLEAFSGCELQLTLDGRFIQTQTIDLPADSARTVGAIRYSFTAAPQKMTLRLQHGATTLSENSYDLTWSDSSSGSFYHQLRRRLADWAMR